LIRKRTAELLVSSVVEVTKIRRPITKIS